MLLTLWMINSKTLTADVFSAGEMDKTLLEQQLKEKGATDGNMYDRKAETLSIQIVVVVVVIVLITAVIGFMVFLRFKRSKEQFPAKPSDKREEMA